MPNPETVNSPLKDSPVFGDFLHVFGDFLQTESQIVQVFGPLSSPADGILKGCA